MRAKTNRQANLLSSIGVKLGGLTTKIDGLLPGVVTLLKKLLGGSGGLLSTSSGSNNFFTSLKSSKWELSFATDRR